MTCLPAKPSSLLHGLVMCSTYRDDSTPLSMDSNTKLAMLFPLGTLEDTSDTSWSWTLIAHVDKVKKAGVEFDPEARTLTSVQGVASCGSALPVRHQNSDAQQSWTHGALL